MCHPDKQVNKSDAEKAAAETAAQFAEEEKRVADRAKAAAAAEAETARVAAETQAAAEKLAESEAQAAADAGSWRLEQQ